MMMNKFIIVVIVVGHYLIHLPTSLGWVQLLGRRSQNPPSLQQQQRQRHHDVMIFYASSSSRLSLSSSSSSDTTPQKKKKKKMLGRNNYYDSAALADDHEKDVERLSRLEDLPQGLTDKMYIVEQYTIMKYDKKNLSSMFDDVTIQRLQLTSTNLTLPTALMVVDPTRYPTFSKARKACRQGKIILYNNSQHEQQQEQQRDSSEQGDIPTTNNNGVSDGGGIRKGTVGDRVYPGQTIGRQETKENILNPSSSSLLSKWGRAPPFDLPVIYEDDHFAVVNKPAGVLNYAEKGKGKNNIRLALLHALHPPSTTTRSTTTTTEGIGIGIKVIVDDPLERPQAVHRLDFLTSGLLVVGKTKSAVVNLAKQFETRTIQKFYTAIVNGIPVVPNNDPTNNNAKATTNTTTTASNMKKKKKKNSNNNNNKKNNATITTEPISSSRKGLELDTLLIDNEQNNDDIAATAAAATLSSKGNCDDDDDDDDDDLTMSTTSSRWNVIDDPLDGKESITAWKFVKKYKWKEAQDGYVSMIELQPKTGRYHQLRRHMAWVYKTPIVGDPLYGVGSGGGRETRKAVTGKRFHRGLMLCSNRIELLHPYYNTVEGRKEWDTIKRMKMMATTEEEEEEEEEGSLELESESESNNHKIQSTSSSSSSSFSFQEDDDGNVCMIFSIDLPTKFHNFFKVQERRLRIYDDDDDDDDDDDEP